MKRYITHILLMALAMMLVSCDKFLEDKPTDRIPADEAYNTINDLWLNAVASIYSGIGGSGPSQGLQGTARGVWDLNTFSTDEAIIPTRGASRAIHGITCSRKCSHVTALWNVSMRLHELIRART